MRKRHRAASIHFLIIVLLMVAAGGDAARAQDRWPPWQSREDAEDAARRAQPKRRSQPKVQNASPAIDAAGAQEPASPTGEERAAPPMQPAAQQVDKPPSTPRTAIEIAATTGARAATKTEIVPLTPHSEGVTAVVFSPNGAQVLSGSYDKTMKMWDTVSGALIRTFEGHTDQIRSIAFSPDGARVLSGSMDKTAKLWDAKTGRLIRSFDVQSFSVFPVAFSPDGTHLLIGSAGETMQLLDASSGEFIRMLEGHSDWILAAAFSPDGRQIVSGSLDKTAKVWDVATGTAIRTFTGYVSSVDAVAFSPDGARIISGSGLEPLKMWDVATGQLVRSFDAPAKSAVESLAFAPDGKRILSGHIGYSGPEQKPDAPLKLWDAETGALIRSWDSGSASSVAFSRDGTRLASSNGSTLKLWDGATYALVHEIGGQTKEINTVAFSPSGAQASTGGGNGTVSLWDVTSGQFVRAFKGHTAEVNAVVFSPDTTRLVSSSSDATIKVWETATGSMIHTLEGKADSAVYSIAISPDGNHVVSSGEYGSLQLWDAATWQLIRAFPENPEIAEFVKSVAFSPDGKRVVSGGGLGGILRLWDIESGRHLRTFEEHSFADVVASTAFSPDGARVLSGRWDGTLKLWDTESGELLRTFEGHSGWVNSVAFSADGRRLLSGGNDKKINLWDAVTGQLVRSFEGHAYKVNSVAFSPDGARIISGSADASARVWNANTGELLVTLIGTGSGEWFSITPEGFFNAASPQAAKLLSAVRGLDVFSIDRFWQSLYRPDLVKEKLAGDPLGKVKQAAAKLDLDKVLDSGLAPRVTITSHKGTGSSQSDLITVAADFQDAGGGIGRVEWRINGITVGVSEGAAQNGAPAKAIERKQDLALDPGDNTIEVIAYNAAVLVPSIPAKTKIKWTGSQPSAKPRLHVLAVGINDYYEGKLKLRFGVPDAASLAAALKEAGRDLYEEITVTTAFDKDATAAHLDQIFEDLQTKIRPRDVFVFFAAGHGKTEDGRYYLVPQDFKYEAGQTLAQLLAARGIGQDRLQKWFSMIPAKKSIVIFDTCESGALAGEQEMAVNTRGGLEQLAAVGRLIQATGRTTLTAAMDDQPAREGYRGHGVFTFALLDALARGDRNGNGLVEVTELLEHVDGLVPEITDKTWHVRQIPRSLFQGSNFALTKQVATLTPAPGEAMIISTAPTHVVAELVEVLASADETGSLVRKLDPFTTLTLIRTEQGWAFVAKDGKALGYVAAAKLHPLQ